MSKDEVQPSEFSQGGHHPTRWLQVQPTGKAGELGGGGIGSPFSKSLILKCRNMCRTHEKRLK